MFGWDRVEEGVGWRGGERGGMEEGGGRRVEGMEEEGIGGEEEGMGEEVWKEGEGREGVVVGVEDFGMKKGDR